MNNLHLTILQLNIERPQMASDSMAPAARGFRCQNAMVAGLPMAVITLTGNATARAQSKSIVRDVQFNRDIRPLLSDRCFFCHGPDRNHREADLRLDQQVAAHSSAITPGNSTASELIDRITSNDPDIRMPPPEAAKTLSADEIDLLRRWIDAGAEYQSHWSFLPSSRKLDAISSEDRRPASARPPWPR